MSLIQATSRTSISSSEIELGNALCWQNIADFTAMAFALVSPADRYLYNWHIGCICEHLHAVHEGAIKRLIINIPPRSLKSIMVSVAWPAWLLGRDPSARIIAASYAQHLATKHSLDCRLIIESDWYRQLFPDSEIAADQNEKAKFMTTKRGLRMATSVGGSLTGEGGDFLILDDPIKPDEAPSETVRQSTNDWVDQVFLTRLNNPKESRVVLVMQRLHMLDTAGHLMEKGGWDLVKIPAEAHRRVQIELSPQNWEMREGDLLHPERMDRTVLDRIRHEIGEYGYAGQYLQEPVPLSGAEFKLEWFQFYENIQSYTGLNLYMIVDPGGDKKKKTSDFTAIEVWALAPDRNYYLVNIVRDRLNTTERVNKIFELQRKYSALSGKPVQVLYKVRGFITELHSLKERMNRETYHFPLVEVIERGEKNERIRRMIPACEQKRVWLPRFFNYVDYTGKNTDLIKDFLDHEVAVFPVGAHDDMLDTASELFNEELASVVVFPRLAAKPHHTPGNVPKTIWDA